MSSGTVPQFPGKGGAATPGKPGPTQARPGWQTAACPFLTAGEIARAQPNLVVTAGVQQQVKAQACLGPQCMLFVTLKQADGSETAGCALVHQYGALLAASAQLQMLNGQVFTFIEAAKAGAAAEAAAAAAQDTGIASLAAAAAAAPAPASTTPEVPTSPKTE